MNEYRLADRKPLFYPAASAEAPLLLTFTTQEETAQLAGLLPEGVALLALDEPDWEHSFTPWPAPRAFKSAPDFGGGADSYLAWLAEDVLPQTEREHGLSPKWRGVLGYSLAGLFAAYCVYRKPLFDRIACVSGSLWFDGWAEFVARETPAFPPHRAYFSVGDQEKNARNPRLAVVQQNTEETEAVWRAAGFVTRFETNSGGHFNDVAERLAKATAWLVRKK